MRRRLEPLKLGENCTSANLGCEKCTALHSVAVIVYVKVMRLLWQQPRLVCTVIIIMIEM